MKNVHNCLRPILSILVAIALLVSMVPITATAATSCEAADLQVNNLENPMGLDDPNPMFSWIMESSARSQVQTAYQILVASSADKLTEDAADLWNTGKVESDLSNNIEYAGAPLSAKTRYYWTVRVWDKDGAASDWSEPATFDMAMLSDSDWTAQWITMENKQQDLNPVVIEFDEPVLARYVRLNVTKIGMPVDDQGLYRLQLAEMEIYGPDDPEKNLALGCTVAVRNTIAVSSWAPTCINDGICYSDPSSYGYSSDAYSTPVMDPFGYVRINLPEDIMINKVVLYPRTDVPAKDDNTKVGSFPADFSIETRPTDNPDYTTQKAFTDYPTPNLPYIEEEETSLPIFGKAFTLDKEIESARAYVSGLGMHEMTINGQKVTDNMFEPGETMFSESVLYSTYDITELLQQGENAVGVMLGKGVYHSPQTPGRYQKLNAIYGPLQLIAQIEAKFTDGSTQVIATDESWKFSYSPIYYSDWWGGEDYDANREIPGWDEPGFSYDVWQNAAISTAKVGKLKAQYSPALKVMEEWDAVAVTEPAEGVYVVDFGRNFAGTFEMRLEAPAGTTIEMIPAEILYENGRVDQSSSSHAGTAWEATPMKDTYTFKGDGVETWGPRFTYHGYRYLEIRGLPFKPEPEMFTAKLIRASNEQVGEFNTSSDTLNQIHTIITRAIEANMYNTLTDCPHREKLGWLEVPQLLYNSIAPNYNVAAWMGKISDDIRESQWDTGEVRAIAPHYADYGAVDPSWTGSCITIPWQNYKTYGDLQLLEESYPSMDSYMTWLTSTSSGNLLTGGLGDWCAFDNSTNTNFVVSCTYYYLACTMSEIAELLEKPEDSARYAALAAEIKTAVNNTYFNAETKNYDSGSQGANAMALYYGLCDPADEQAVLENIVAAVRKADNHLTVGEIAMKPLYLVLGEYGRNDVVYDMACNRTMPSYWYFIECGMTSLPETWNMNSSLNHCMMGHLEGWFYEQFAGIRNESVGYKAMTIEPYSPKDLDFVDISTQTLYGKVTSSWTRNEDGTLTVRVVVPANTTATVVLPSNDFDNITESGIPLAKQKDGIVSYAADGEKARIEVGSGSYEFVCADPVSFDELSKVIETAEQGFDPSNVFSGLEELHTAVEAGKQVLNNAAATQDEVDAAVAMIEEAINNVKLFNIALNRTVSASSSMEAIVPGSMNWTAANLTNGNRTDGEGGYSSSTAQAAAPHTEWVQVDFGASYAFNTVDLYPRNLEAYNNAPAETFPEDFDIQVSDDGNNWTTVQEVRGYPAPTEYTAQRFTFDEVKARYVRIYAHKLRPFSLDAGQYFMQFAEMEVYDVPDPLKTPESVTANQSFTFTVRTDAGVDQIALLNEYGLNLGKRVIDVQENRYGQKEWTLSTVIGTIGAGRTISVYTMMSNEPYEKLADFTLDVVPAIPELISVEAPEQVKVGETFTVTAVTDTNANRIAIYNEYGLKVCTATSGFIDQDGVRIWNIPVKIGTAGAARQLSVIAEYFGKLTAESEPMTTQPIQVTYF